MKSKYKTSSQECLKIPHKNTQTELPPIISLDFLRYSCFTELQLKFTTKRLFHILDRVLILRPDPYISLLAHTPFMCFITGTVCIHGTPFSVKKRGCFMIQSDTCCHVYLCFQERRGGKSPKN